MNKLVQNYIFCTFNLRSSNHTNLNTNPDQTSLLLEENGVLHYKYKSLYHLSLF